MRGFKLELMAGIAAIVIGILLPLAANATGALGMRGPEIPDRIAHGE